MLDPKAGTLEGWSRSNLTSKSRKGEQAARGKGNSSAAESKKRSREEEDEQTKGDNSDEASSKQARLDSVGNSSLNAGAHQRMDLPPTPLLQLPLRLLPPLSLPLPSPPPVPDSTLPANHHAETSDPPLPEHFDPFTDESGRSLPYEWRREQSRSTGDYFYTRDEDGFTMWENPLDEVPDAAQEGGVRVEKGGVR